MCEQDKNELIAVNFESDKPTVNGRELHAALGVDTEYAKWFERMCAYGFQEGKSYSSILTNRSDGLPGKPRTDHELTISMAKELCMLQRSEKGKMFREYFISVEEAWNTPEKIMERAWQIARKQAAEAERRIFALAAENDTLSVALNTSLDYWTVMKYNTVHGMKWPMAKCQSIGRRLAAFCRERGYDVRACQTNDERFNTVNSYPVTAWEAFIAEKEGIVNV